MIKNCGCNKNSGCGCGDHVLTTKSCATGECAVPEKCAEVFSSECVKYMGNTIANLDINKGDPMTTVIQKIAMAIVNPNCAYPTSPCRGVTGFGDNGIGSTSIKLVWDALTGVTNYQVEYKAATSGTWLLNTAVTTNSDIIGGLTTNTDYHVRVKTLCSSASCYSLVLLITTKP